MNVSKDITSEKLPMWGTIPDLNKQVAQNSEWFIGKILLQFSPTVGQKLQTTPVSKVWTHFQNMGGNEKAAEILAQQHFRTTNLNNDMRLVKPLGYHVMPRSITTANYNQPYGLTPDILIEYLYMAPTRLSGTKPETSTIFPQTENVYVSQPAPNSIQICDMENFLPPKNITDFTVGFNAPGTFQTMLATSDHQQLHTMLSVMHCANKKIGKPNHSSWLFCPATPPEFLANYAEDQGRIHRGFTRTHARKLLKHSSNDLTPIQNQFRLTCATLLNQQPPSDLNETASTLLDVSLKEIWQQPET